MSAAIRFDCVGCGKPFELEIPDGAVGVAQKLYADRLCPTCNDAKHQEFMSADDRLRQRSAEEKRALFLASCGIPEGLQGKSFNNFDPRFDGGRYTEAHQRCQAWAESFNPRKAADSSSIVLYASGYGTGKTHMAAAIGRTVIQKLSNDNAMGFGNPVHFTTAADALIRISASRVPDFAGGSRETESVVYDQLGGTRLLILDDVGKERPRADLQEFYYTVINRRYTNNLPIIITSNVPPEAKQGVTLADIMGEAAVSRLRVMAVSMWLPMDGPDYRRVQAKNLRDK